MQITRNRRNALITGVATLAVAGSATLALALPQDTRSSPVAAVSDSAASKSAAAADAQAEAQQLAAAETQKLAADAKAKADAAAKAQADADAKAQADAAAKAKADAAAAASRSQQRSNLNQAFTGTPQQIAAQIVPASQLQCFDNIIQRESGWNVTATNPSSGAYGLVQALPGSKMATAGADWRTNPATQIKWGLSYMNATYGSPCGAWKFWQAHSAY